MPTPKNGKSAPVSPKTPEKRTNKTASKQPSEAKVAPDAVVEPVASSGRSRVTKSTRRIGKEGVANHLPVLPLLSVVVFPLNVMSFIVRKPHNIAMLDEGERTKGIFCLAGQRDTSPDKPTELGHLYEIGVAGRLIHRINLPDGSVQVTFQGLVRVKLKAVLQTEPHMRAEIAVLNEPEITGASQVEVSALMAEALNLFEQVVHTNPTYSNEMVNVLKLNIEGPGRFADMIATFLNFPLAEKNELLAELDTVERLKKLLNALTMELAKNVVEHDVQVSAQKLIEKSQREYILRQQLSAIKKELGESDDAEAEVQRLRETLNKAGLPAHAKRKAEDELRRLELVSPASAEYNVVRTYLDWLLGLPWSKSSADNLDLIHARKVLDDGHFGLGEVKDRIIEFLAVLQLRGEVSGSILCLQGPPGVGKTSLGRGIAEALGRSFQRISVGGLRDEAEIRGHRRTYVGAMPGLLVQALRRVAVKDPVIMIDEIDKMGSDFRGDPASAMLEVLDPSQNSSFNDRYLDLGYDLSKVLFICTANVLETIPGPLLDRMEVIRLSSYTRREKFEIARRHIVARQRKMAGLTEADIEITDAALSAIVDNYTREAGVRNLERTVGAVCRKIAVRIATGTKSLHRVEPADLEDLIGPARITRDPRLAGPEIGVATGLGWTSTGGELLFIEATRYAGKGRLTITGSLGDVMKESVSAALSYVHAHADVLGIKASLFDEVDIHLHFPEGATPKDGPSAGVTIVTALTSLLTDKPVRPDVAMTGEVTLRGKVLAIGGVKEKVLAAHRAGITKVLLPEANRKDLRDVPQEARDAITFVFCSDVRDNIRESIIDLVLPRNGMDAKIITSALAPSGDAASARR